MNIFLKRYIENLTEEDIYNYALKEGITLLGDESKIILVYLKNYYQVLLSGDPTFIFEELKEKLRDETYHKMIELYNKYKSKYLGK